MDELSVYEVHQHMPLSLPPALVLHQLTASCCNTFNLPTQAPAHAHHNQHTHTQTPRSTHPPTLEAHASTEKTF